MRESVVKERGTDMLPVQLTDDEVRQRGEEIARLFEQIDDMEEERRAANKDAKAAIGKLELARKLLAQEVRTRTERREVGTETRLNFADGVCETVRTDTGEIVRTRPLSMEERQGRLDFATRDAKRAAGAARDAAKKPRGRRAGKDEAAEPDGDA